MLKTTLPTDLKQGSRSSEYNTDTNIYVLQEVHEKYEISLFLQRTRIPSDNQLQSDICAFFYILHAFPDRLPRHSTAPGKYNCGTGLQNFLQKYFSVLPACRNKPEARLSELLHTTTSSFYYMS